MSQDPILIQQDGRVLIVTLNRPDRRNAITAALVERLAEVIDAATSDPSVGALLLRGAGDHFCAGGDLSSLSGEASGMLSTPARTARALAAAMIVQRLAELPKPTVAMLRGAVAGGGLALAAACDFRLTDATLKLTFAYTRVGLPGDLAATPLLLRLTGSARFRELAFLSPLLDAEQAAAFGLVRVVNGDLESEAMSLAARLAEIAPLAIAGLKANIAAAEAGDFAAAIAEEASNFARSQADPNHLEATRAFLEKRKPVFDLSAAGSK